MRRRTTAIAMVVGLALLSSGCSLREVQLWFQFNRKQVISRPQARSIGDLVNSKRQPGGCDGNYTGSCVPDNATVVHCRGASGDGPAVTGPLSVTGWDTFELDPDGDHHACVDPVGQFDRFGQQIDGVRISGWAFDPDTDDSIEVDVYIDGVYSHRSPAGFPRPDVAMALPGVTASSGFDEVVGVWNAEPHQYCVFLLNVGPGRSPLLQCKTISAIYPTEAVGADGSSVIALLEGVDRSSDGSIHIRGFQLHRGGAGVSAPTLDSQGGTYRFSAASQDVRPDVNFAYGTDTATGFDVVLPPSEGVAWGTEFCLRYAFNGGVASSCRRVDT